MIGDHYIYIVAGMEPFAGPVKIGITRNLNSRLSKLNNGSPRKLGFVHYFMVPEKPLALGLERAFFEVMKEHRLNGEWFDLDPVEALRAMICNLFSHFDLVEDEEIKRLAFERSGMNEAVRLMLARGIEP